MAQGSPLRILGQNLMELRRDLDHQRIVWLEGHVDPRQFHPKLPPGITIAGRGKPDNPPPSRESLPPPGRGADTGAVFAVAVDPGLSQTVYAGTRNGLQVSRDGGDHWSTLRTGVGPTRSTRLPSPAGARPSSVRAGPSGTASPAARAGLSPPRSPSSPSFFNRRTGRSRSPRRAAACSERRTAARAGSRRRRE